MFQRTSLATMLTACACIAVGAAYADGTDDAPARANRMAYDASLKCFVAGGIAVGDAQKLRDATKETYFDAKARLSFDTAVRLGEKLGLTKEHVDEDFGLVQARELPRMIGNTAYYKDAVAYCKALGLM